MAEMHDDDLAEKVRFLGAPGVLASAGEPLQVRETHMSWVFLTKDLVFKLKKPVRFSYLDFSSCAAREAACRDELRLNQTLAADVYLRLVRLSRGRDGGLELDGQGETVDWLVLMRRLPAEHMLDDRLKAGTATAADIAKLVDLLASFYASAPRVLLPVDGYVDRLRRQIAEDREIICMPRFAIDKARAIDIMDRLDGAFSSVVSVLRQRVVEGRIVEGHGDLRPEHVWIGDPIRVIDRLEFNLQLRLVDPFYELAYLGMECTMLGADWAARLLIAHASRAIIDPAPMELVRVYTAIAASLRARLSLAHLLDPSPRDPGRWEPQAERYLDQAAAALSLPPPAAA